MKQLQNFAVVAILLALGNLFLLVDSKPTRNSDWSKCVEGSDMIEPPECPPQDPEHAVYFPFPYNCKQYFECVHGIAYCLQCPPGTVWDQPNQICNHRAVVNCTIYTTIPTTTTFRPPKTTVDPISWVCPVGYNESIRHPYNCSEYYVCNPPHPPTKQFCNDGLYYSPITKNCEYPYNVTDCVDGTPPAPTPTTPKMVYDGPSNYINVDRYNVVEIKKLVFKFPNNGQRHEKKFDVPYDIEAIEKYDGV